MIRNTMSGNKKVNQSTSHTSSQCTQLLTVGADVGVADGGFEGELVGLDDGAAVGADVGVADGLDEGELVGLDDGVAVGADVGTVLHFFDALELVLDLFEGLSAWRRKIRI